MRLTERQYANIYIVSGEADLQEKVAEKLPNHAIIKR